MTTIGGSAFRDCTRLTGIVVPNGVTVINEYTFNGCTSLASASLPEGVTTIGNNAFRNCSSLSAFAMPSTVKSIGWYAFQNCSSLGGITIPAGVASMSNSPFEGCTGFTWLEWNAVNCSYNGGIPTDNLEHITIGDGVTVLPGNFAKNSKITEILIPSSVTNIGGYAFYGCTSLLSIISRAVVPPTVANDYTFQTCYATAKLKVPRGVIEDYKAANYWKNFLTIVGDEYDFEVDGIYYVKTGENTASVTYKDTDYNTYSGTVSIPKQVDYEGVTYRVTGVSFEAFKDCPDLTKVTMSKRIKSIGYNAFENCTSLTRVTIPDNVTAIGANAFNGCSALTEAIIGSSVATIGTQAFDGCDNLTTVMSRSVTPPTLAGMSCFNCYETATLKVPIAAVEDYSSADYWKEFMEIIGVEINAGSGDVDGDGNIGIADVTALIDYLLTGSGTSFYEENADFDEDGNIGIADVTALIDYLLTGGDD